MTDTGRLTGSRERSQSSLSSPVGFDPGRFVELAERCEKATRADRELDAAIAIGAAGWRYQPHVTHNFKWHDGRFDVPGPPPKYTASLDAAMTLVPEGHDMQINLYWGRDGEGSASVSPLKQLNLPRVFAATPALALCAAALKARALTPPSESTEK